MHLNQTTPEQLHEWHSSLSDQYQTLQKADLNLDLTRGKPSSEQLSLSDALDGILIQKEGVSSKPQLFCEIDGWFYYNFIKNSSNIKLEVNPKK